MTRICLASLLGLITAAVVTHENRSWSQQESVCPGINSRFESPDVPQFVERFEREGRDVFDRRKEVLEACQIKPGTAVADIGAGTGLFSRLLAEHVGPEGKVYAVDIAEDFVQHIRETGKQAGLGNIVGVVCDEKSAKLPPHSVDLAFICDTYHHFEYPQQTMRSIHRALRPKGQLVLIGFHRIEGVSSDWILEHVRAGQETFTQEIVDAGFKPIQEKKDLLKDSYFVRFAKVDAGQD